MNCGFVQTSSAEIKSSDNSIECGLLASIGTEQKVILNRFSEHFEAENFQRQSIAFGIRQSLNAVLIPALMTVLFIVPGFCVAQATITGQSAADASIGAKSNNGAGQFQSSTQQGVGQGTAGNPTAPTGNRQTDPTLPRVARLLNSPGSLPSDAGQVWRTYDLSPYTRRITNVKNPENAVIEWITRETGANIWFKSPMGILTAASDRLHVYHTPEVQKKVAGIVDRIVNSQGKNVTLGIRMMTIGKPDWRAAAFARLQSIEVRAPGVEGWLVSKENAAIIANQFSRRADYQALEIGNLVLPEGQTYVFKKRQLRPYIRSQKFKLLNPNFPASGGQYEPVTSRFEEGYTLKVSPLGMVGSNFMEVGLKCQIDQLEKFHTVNIPVPLVNGQTQNLATYVPQVVSWRLDERFQWPKDKVLMLSCGVVATTGKQDNNPLLNGLLGNQKGRGEAILMIEFKGAGSQLNAQNNARQNGTQRKNAQNRGTGQIQGRSAMSGSAQDWRATTPGRVAADPNNPNSQFQLQPIRR